MLTMSSQEIEEKAKQHAARLQAIDKARMDIQLLQRSSKAGGGALPLLNLPSHCLGIKIQQCSANTLERQLRDNDPPIIGRIEEDKFIMDLRTVQEEEISIIETAFASILKRV